MRRACPKKGSPPSSYAAYALVQGEPRGLVRFGALTGLRTFIIVPGLAAAGVPQDDLLKSSFFASLGISAFTLLVSAAEVRAERNGHRRRRC